MNPAQHPDFLQLGEVAAHGFAGDAEAFGQVGNADFALQRQLFGDEAVAFFGKHDVEASGLCDASHGDLCSYDFRRTAIAMSTQNNTKPNKHRSDQNHVCQPAVRAASLSEAATSGRSIRLSAELRTAGALDLAGTCG